MQRLEQQEGRDVELGAPSPPPFPPFLPSLPEPSLTRTLVSFFLASFSPPRAMSYEPLPSGSPPSTPPRHHRSLSGLTQLDSSPSHSHSVSYTSSRAKVDLKSIEEGFSRWIDTVKAKGKGKGKKKRKLKVKEGDEKPELMESVFGSGAVVSLGLRGVVRGELKARLTEVSSESARPRRRNYPRPTRTRPSRTRSSWRSLIR